VSLGCTHVTLQQQYESCCSTAKSNSRVYARKHFRIENFPAAGELYSRDTCSSSSMRLINFEL
uniref:Uncharacterized protein n=1 Tax=Triticum urartu TaxID=4572 RepID=A0A8R7R0T0_TRIUA